MTRSLPVDEWLDVIEREYLSTFVRDGGGAVKFAIADEWCRSVISERLKSRCETLGYLLVGLDAAASRAHMPQDIFHAVASQLDWRLLARRFILRVLEAKSYRVEGIDPGRTVSVVVDVARANGLEAHFVIRELRPLVQDEVSKNRRMVRAFRAAMTHLCLREMDTARPGDYSGTPLLDWLTGRDTRISNVRPFQIHSVINRATARYFIESALYWVRHAGYSGTVILLDNTRLALTRNPRDGQRYYTRSMVVEHYEVLRQYIDDADRLPGAFVVVVPDETFVDESSPRGWGIYPALRTRVMDDVRDRNIGNPVAALVRLSDGREA